MQASLRTQVVPLNLPKLWGFLWIKEIAECGLRVINFKILTKIAVTRTLRAPNGVTKEAGTNA